MAGAQLSGAEDRQHDRREHGVRSESRSHPPQDGRCPHSTGRRLKPALCRRRRGRGPTMGHHSTRHPAVSHVLTLLKDCKLVNCVRSMPISMYSGWIQMHQGYLHTRDVDLTCCRKQHLPKYMVPPLGVIIDAMPLNANGNCQTNSAANSWSSTD